MQTARGMLGNLSLQLCLQISSEQVELSVSSIGSASINQLCFCLYVSPGFLSQSKAISPGNLALLLCSDHVFLVKSDFTHNTFCYLYSSSSIS